MTVYCMVLLCNEGTVLMYTHSGQGHAYIRAELDRLQCRLGRRILRPLLRSELGEVANRRTWFDVTKLTPEVLQLYKQPLKVQGWDLALLEVAYCIV